MVAAQANWGTIKNYCHASTVFAYFSVPTLFQLQTADNAPCLTPLIVDDSTQTSWVSSRISAMLPCLNLFLMPTLYCLILAILLCYNTAQLLVVAAQASWGTIKNFCYASPVLS